MCVVLLLFVVLDQSGDLDFYAFDWQAGSKHSTSTLSHIQTDELNKVCNLPFSYVYMYVCMYVCACEIES